MSVLFDTPGPKAVRRHRILGVITVLVLAAIAVAVVLKLAAEDQFTSDKWEPFVTPSIINILLEGLRNTVLAAVIAIAISIVAGLVFGVGKLSNHRAVRWPAWLVVEFFRAVPLLMLIYFIFSVWSENIGSLWSLIIGLALYNGSVLAEVFRAGINAVPKGQAEAAYSLGMRKTQVVTIVQLPQATRIMLPAIISQCIVALKDTSLGFTILAPGLTYAGREIWNTFHNKFATALVLMAIYIVLNCLLSLLASFAERRLSSSEGAATVEIVGGQVLTKA